MTHKQRYDETIKQENAYIRKGAEEYNEAFDEIEKEVALFTSKYGVDGKLDQAEANKYDRQKKLAGIVAKILGKVTIMNVPTFGGYSADQYDSNFKAQKAILEQLTSKPMKYKPKPRKTLIDELLGGLDRVALLNNNQQLKNKVARGISQGITQGKSSRQTSKLVKEAMNSNAKNAMRIVRTETTKAMNAATLDSMDKAAATGIEIEKQWLATQDSRTRDTHAAMDGETVALDKPFSNGLMYPGDPSGDASEVIHCRCTLVEVLKDVLVSKKDELNKVAEEEQQDLAKVEAKAKKDVAKIEADAKAKSDAKIKADAKAKSDDKIKADKKAKLEIEKKAEAKKIADAKAKEAKKKAEADAKKKAQAKKETPKVEKPVIKKPAEAKPKVADVPKDKQYKTITDAKEFEVENGFTKENLLDKLTLDEAKAVDHYTGVGYRVNGDLRTGKLSDIAPENKTMMKNLDTALEKGGLKEDIKVYRAMGVDDDTLTGLLKGNTLKDNGYMSTTTKQSYGKSFRGKKVVIEIDVPAGTKGLYINPISRMKRESEFLMPRGVELEIKEIIYGGDKKHTILKAVIKQ